MKRFSFTTDRASQKSGNLFNGMNKLVFVVEDNPVQQKMLQVHFEEMLGNYTVRTFSHPDEMIKHLKEKPFAVVLDHFFGENKDKTGLHYLREMRKHYTSIPVIYYTTLNDESVRKEAKTLGVEHFIIKDSAYRTGCDP
jgi:two-component system, NarL family, response regulator, fimbrial Z protein, FimZ